ncbi:SDR family NAD(P)-dependent oxidoreductase, partial [bacterium]
MIDLHGQHIFVAGGSRGIGRATCLMAARAGAVVSVNYRQDNAAAQDVVAQIEALGGKAFAVQADLSVDGEAKRALDEATNALGKLSGLVIAAGIFEGIALD